MERVFEGPLRWLKSEAGWQKFKQIPDQKMFNPTAFELRFQLPHMPYELKGKVLFYSSVALVSCRRNPAEIDLMPGRSVL